MNWSERKIKMKEKKAQIRMSETVAVLFIFFVLVLFGIIFYYKYQQASLVEKQEELLAARAIETTSKTLFMPELICSRGEAEPEDNCFDVLKLKGLNDTVYKYLDDYYIDIFSYAKVYVQEVYPGNSTWVIYDKQKPEAIRSEPTYFIVTLKDEASGGNEPSYGLGYLAVVIYS